MVGKLNGDVKQSESSFNSYVNVVSLVKLDNINMIIQSPKGRYSHPCTARMQYRLAMLID